MAPKKDKALFTFEKECQLVQLIERRVILWDSTAECYKRADLKRSVWAEVALAMGPEYTGNQIYFVYLTLLWILLYHFNEHSNRCFFRLGSSMLFELVYQSEFTGEANRT